MIKLTLDKILDLKNISRYELAKRKGIRYKPKRKSAKTSVLIF